MKRFRRAFRLAPLCLAVLSAAAPEQVADQWLAKPVDDKTFHTYLEFFTYDHGVPFDVRVLDAEEKEGVRKEHLSFQSTPGMRVFANYYQGPAPQKRSHLILLHGGNANGKDGAAFQALAPLLVRAGWNVFAIDLLHFGERGTGLLSTYTEQEKCDRLYSQPPTYLAWVTQTVKDAGRSIDLLVEQRGVDPKRIGLVGASRGAILGTIVGAAERRLAAVVLLYGGHFITLERQHLPAACPANYIGRISPRPLLMINGTQDNMMLKDTSVLPLHRLAKPPKLNLWTETGHRVLPQEFFPKMLQWLRENLP